MDCMDFEFGSYFGTWTDFSGATAGFQQKQNMKHLEVIKGRIFTINTLKVWLSQQHLLSKSIVFTNGCFDILHQGHVDYLSKAADMGDLLVVGVNSDDSVKRLEKGAARPIQQEQSRAMLIAALHFVSAVIIFDEDTPLSLIEMVQPNVLVKGADWQLKDIVGYDFVTSRGGQVKTIEYLPGFSTSAIESKIKNA